MKIFRKPVSLSILSGLLLWAAWPPTPYSTFLIFIGFVPMLIAMEKIIRSDIRKKGTRLFATTFIGFFIWNTLSIYWVYNSIKTIGPLIAVPISFIPYSLGPLLMSSACWFYYRLREKTGVKWALAGFACFWMSFEFLHQWWDLAFPWMTLGNAFAVSHQWIQWYEFTGVYGGSLWILAANMFFFLAYGRYANGQKPAATRQLAFGLMIVLLPLVASLWRYFTFHEKQDPANIVVVQPNIDPYLKSGGIPEREQFARLVQLTDSVAQPNTEFILWPETALPQELDEDEIRQTPQYADIRRFLNRYKNGNLLTGIESYKIYKNDATATAQPIPDGRWFDRFNAAANFENSSRVQFYHKSKLVPGVEQMPFGSALSFLKPVFRHLGGSTGGYGKQPEPGVFYAQSGIGTAPVICYESIWGDYVSGYIKKGAQFISIITNDGWWENSPGKDQHYLYAKLRAIECRRWVARSANTGISCFINERGDVVQKTAWWVPAALNQTINLNEQLTFYVRFPDLLVWFALAGSVVFLLRILILKFKRT
ncbi:MAG: apolipoprotein N-acyltransferase [Mucilaginibacter polytrichastri]|nr:apolipoprotein N-acyltransferase [Mucilaginibacter polytrichastri]